MRRALVILSPLLPPLKGGLADHTYELARHLAADRAVTVVCSRDVYNDVPFNVRSVIHDWEDAAEIAGELIHVPPDAILLWQYVPHMYGRGGVNRSLVKLWSSLHQRGRRQIFLAHEIAGPWGKNLAHWWYAWNQRRQWKTLVRVAELVGISTEAWLIDWKNRLPKRADRMFLMPSPSNIPVVRVAEGHRQQRRKAHNLPPDIPLMTWFGTVAATKQLPWVIEAWEAVNREVGTTGLCVVGGTPGIPIPSTLRPWYRSCGYLPSGEVSEAMQAMDLLALPFSDGISERRGTLMTGLSHGLPVVATLGHNSGPALRSADFLVATPANAKADFVRAVVELMRDPARRAELGRAGRAHYDAHYGWRPTVARLEGELARIDLV